MTLRWGLAWEWEVLSHHGKVSVLAIDLLYKYSTVKI